MKFYVIENGSSGEIAGCELTKKDAVSIAECVCDGSYSITMVECKISVDTVRRLLGELGGYAIQTQRIK